MAERKIINTGNTIDDGTGDLLRDAFVKVNDNFESLWEVTAVDSNIDITGDSINSTGQIILSPTDELLVNGSIVINNNNQDADFTVHGESVDNVLFVDASAGRVGIKNNAPTVELDVTGSAKISGTVTTENLTVTGSTTIGNAVSDIINFNSRVGTSFEPYGSRTLGSIVNRWNNGYFTNLDVSGVISGTFTGSIDPGIVLTNDINNANVTTDTLEVSTSAEIETLLVRGNLAVQGTTTTIDSATIQFIDSLTFEGATDDDFEVVLTVTDPTADRIITLQDADGTLAFTSDIPTVPTTISSFTNDSGYITDYTVTSDDVTAHEANLSITESQISDFGTYATVASLATVATTGSYNDLTDTTNVVTSTTVPTGSVGNSGDVEGLVAFDSSYMYYCTASYDGSTDIWKRIAWSVDTW